MNLNSKKTKIYAVIVTYKTSVSTVERLLDSIKSQVDKLFIVDNTPKQFNKNELEKFRDEKTEIIYLNENTGIAYAQNIGIKKALAEKADFIMLSDDDTIYPENYIKEMIKVFEEKKEEEIAAVAPLYKNIVTGEYRPFIRKSTFGFKKYYFFNGYHEISQAIASGLILNSQYLEKIGLMNENLFLDYVDLEWCWRAIRGGYKIIGNANVFIEHKLGDYSKKIGKKQVPLHNPSRNYYITRNNTYLALHCNDIGLMQKISLFMQSFVYLIAYPVLSKPHLVHLKYCVLGFWHGITKKMGRFDSSN